MKAHAALQVRGSRCQVLRSDPPLTFRETIDGLSWVGSAAAPVGGDELRLDVQVGRGASLTLTSVAASMAHPGPSGEPSHTTIDLRSAGSVRWQPRPTVLVRGCDHRASVTIALAAGATLLWRDEVVLGRHDEESGSLRQRLTVDRHGSPLLRNELVVGPRWPGSLGPAGTGGAGAIGTLLLVGVPFPGPAPTLGVRFGVQPLADDAVLVTAVAARAGALTSAFDQLSAPEPAVP